MKWGGIIAQGMMQGAVGGFNALMQQGVNEHQAKLEEQKQRVLMEREMQMAAIRQQFAKEQASFQSELGRKDAEFRDSLPTATTAREAQKEQTRMAAEAAERAAQLHPGALDQQGAGIALTRAQTDAAKQNSDARMLMASVAEARAANSASGAAKAVPVEDEKGNIRYLTPEEVNKGNYSIPGQRRAAATEERNTEAKAKNLEGEASKLNEQAMMATGAQKAALLQRARDKQAEADALRGVKTSDLNEFFNRLAQ